MVFRTRNCYYLRISEKMVLPLYLYLDERHLDWMSDVVLQHVLSDLRPRILPKLQMEANIGTSSKNAKLSTVDTHRGETYQFCYFIRNVEPHSVVIKVYWFSLKSGLHIAQNNNQTRRFAAASPKPKPATVPPKLAAKPRPTRAAKRKAPPPKKAPKKKKWKGKKKADASPDDMDEDELESSSSDIYISDSDEDMDEDDEAIGEGAPQDEQAGASTFDLEIEEEEKPKPILSLRYQGFQIYGKCLCVVVEPWPLPKAPSRSINAVLGARDKSRLSVPPRRPSPSVQQSAALRGETPLFLPDDDTDALELPSVASLFTMEKESDDGEGHRNKPYSGMMAFSQALKNTSDERPGALAVDDEDVDSAALFGDADEVREL